MAHPFSMVLLQLPFVACVTVQVALAALLQVPALHVNVADPERQDDPSVRLMLTPELVALAVAKQLCHVFVSLGQDGSGTLQ